jgi:hypothetical protein
MMMIRICPTTTTTTTTKQLNNNKIKIVYRKQTKQIDMHKSFSFLCLLQEHGNGEQKQRSDDARGRRRVVGVAVLAALVVVAAQTILNAIEIEERAEALTGRGRLVAAQHLLGAGAARALAEILGDQLARRRALRRQRFALDKRDCRPPALGTAHTRRHVDHLDLVLRVGRRRADPAGRLLVARVVVAARLAGAVAGKRRCRAALLLHQRLERYREAIEREAVLRIAGRALAADLFGDGRRRARAERRRAVQHDLVDGAHRLAGLDRTIVDVVLAGHAKHDATGLIRLQRDQLVVEIQIDVELVVGAKLGQIERLQHDRSREADLERLVAIEQRRGVAAQRVLAAIDRLRHARLVDAKALRVAVQRELRVRRQFAAGSEALRHNGRRHADAVRVAQRPRFLVARRRERRRAKVERRAKRLHRLGTSLDNTETKARHSRSIVRCELPL